MADRAQRRMSAERFVHKYGAGALANLLQDFADGRSGQAIADDLGVSRERVRQWKNTFGRVVTLYQVHGEVEALLDAELPELTL